MAVVVPDIPDLFEEAYARAGLELRTGNDLRNARRSFNLLTMEWQNRGLNLWTIASGTLSPMNALEEEMGVNFDQKSTDHVIGM